MKTLITTIRNILALGVSAGLSYVIGAVLSSVFVLRALPVNIPLSHYISTALSDIKGLSLYLAIILIGFLIAFPIAALLRKRLPRLAKMGYPLAGAAAIAAMLGLMYMQFDTVPISGARGAFGFAAQMLAGAIGGFVFGKLQKPLNN